MYDVAIIIQGFDVSTVIGILSIAVVTLRYISK